MCLEEGAAKSYTLSSVEVAAFIKPKRLAFYNPTQLAPPNVALQVTLDVTLCSDG